MLDLKLLMSRTSIKKYESMEAAVCEDGRVHGLLQFYGASRTGRWAGRLVQVQNLPRCYIEELDDALPPDAFTRLELPWEAGFLAGKAFLQYRRAKGARTSPLPDFYIGAHAAIERMALLTRDAKRYRTYYPKLELICP